MGPIPARTISDRGDRRDIVFSPLLLFPFYDGRSGYPFLLVHPGCPAMDTQALSRRKKGKVVHDSSRGQVGSGWFRLYPAGSFFHGGWVFRWA